MKTLLFTLLIFPAFCLAQKKGDNTVVIKDNAVTIEILKKEMLKQGFAIDKDSPTYLTTEVMQRKGWYGVKFSALQDADSIILKGWVKTDISISGVRSNELIVADYKGMKGSANKDAFIELLQLATKLSDKAYSTKQ
jgi:hypothetical protein